MSNAAVVQAIVNTPVSMPKKVQHGVSTGFDEEMKKAEAAKKEFNFVTFLSLRKEAAFYYTFDEVLCFKNYSFKTTKKEHQDYFRNLSFFGTEIFEGTYPPEIIAKMKQEKNEMTKFKEDGGE